MTQYPSSIVGGHEAVWDLYVKAGPRPGCGTLRPSGLWMPDNGSYEDVDVNMAFTGPAAAGAVMLRPGTTQGGANKGRPLYKSFHGNFDMAGGNPAPHALIDNGQSFAPALFVGARFVNAPRDAISWKGPLTLVECLMGSFGSATTPGDHTEPLQFLGGFFQSINCLYDPTFGSLPLMPGVATSGTPFLETTTQEVFALLDGNVCVGMQACKMPYTFQLKANNFNGVCVVQNMVMERGTSGYFGVTNVGPNTFRLINGGNNTDFHTGQLITDLTRG